jgi:division protein CdvB (Snf7/Vps24/ESCRT-III family)
MNHAVSIFFLPLVAAGAVFAQSAAPESRGLDALVSEIHQLRQDLQTTTVAAQRVQIALFRLQTQTTAVVRATSRLDEVRSRISQSQSHHREMAARMEQIEQNQRTSQDAHEVKSIAEVLPQVKAELEREAGEEQQLQAREADAASQFRVEQAKLSELQDLLDKLDKILDGYGKK